MTTIRIVLLSVNCHGNGFVTVYRLERRPHGAEESVVKFDDLGNIALVSLVSAEAREKVAPGATSPLWKLGDASPALLQQLEDALTTFLPPPGAHFVVAHPIVLIDQNNAVRGFWPNDAAGRGNSINAARLLAKEGPTP